MKIFYFSWVREKVGISNEDFSLPQHVTNIEQLAKFLQSKGGGYSDAFADLSVSFFNAGKRFVITFLRRFNTFCMDHPERIRYFVKMCLIRERLPGFLLV